MREKEQVGHPPNKLAWQWRSSNYKNIAAGPPSLPCYKAQQMYTALQRRHALLYVSLAPRIITGRNDARAAAGGEDIYFSMYYTFLWLKNIASSSACGDFGIQAELGTKLQFVVVN